VIEAGRKVSAVEVKAATRWSESDLAGLRAFVERTPACIAAVLAYNGREAVQLDDRLFAIPLGCWGDDVTGPSRNLREIPTSSHRSVQGRRNTTCGMNSHNASRYAQAIKTGHSLGLDRQERNSVQYDQQATMPLCVSAAS
jgi:hypothetical protein